MNAAIYCRTATEGQGEPSALDRQETACRAYAILAGHTIGPVYREVASGLGTDRPALAALGADIAAGRVGLVLVTARDRLSRSWQATHDLLEGWVQSDIRVIAVGEGQ